jgi:hypothetical protein
MNQALAYIEAHLDGEIEAAMELQSSDAIFLCSGSMHASPFKTI